MMLTVSNKVRDTDHMVHQGLLFKLERIRVAKWLDRPFFSRSG